MRFVRVVCLASVGLVTARDAGVQPRVTEPEPQSITAQVAPAPPAEVSQARAQLAPALATPLDRVIQASWSQFDMNAAMSHVQFVGQYWRLAGNSGYDATIDRARARLIAAGFADGKVAGQPSVWTEEYKPGSRGWEHSVGTLALVHPGRADERVLSREQHHIALCINSFSTAPGGVVAPLVDVGRGDRDEDYATKDVKGAVVLGDAEVGRLWQRALAHGAIGVVSGSLGDYINPDLPDAKVATPRDQWDILQWGSVPYDETHKAFGFKATPHAVTTLRAAAAAGASQVHVTIVATFSDKPARTLIAEVPGRTLPNERVIVAAHVQEPGANDNASGVATLTELVRGFIRNLQSTRIEPPDRTMTFMWLEETVGSRQWLTDHKEDVPGVKYMFSMDMTGEDVKKTGGAFLVERWPDPAAVWERPWDPHSEWGAGRMNANQLHGDLINDLHLAVCERVATRSDWAVRSNPYEGGSDHSVYGEAGVPAVLNWHFTDRYYHSNFDTPDKTSREEMRNVGVALTASAWMLASANEARALAIADLVSRAGQARIAVETREGAKLAAAAPDPTAALAREQTILQAWRKWYTEAVQSAHRLLAGPASADFDARVKTMASPFGGKTASSSK